MSSKNIHLVGLVFLIAAAVVSVLNLKRVADLGMPWLTTLLLVIGMLLVVVSRRRK